MNNSSGIAIIILLSLIILINIYNITFEKFTVGSGQAFSTYINPVPPCTPENNCFPGAYFRSQVYQNMCEPSNIENGGLSREKISLIDNCVKSLGSQLDEDKYSYKTFKDNHGVEHNYWKQNF